MLSQHLSPPTSTLQQAMAHGGDQSSNVPLQSLRCNNRTPLATNNTHLFHWGSSNHSNLCLCTKPLQPLYTTSQQHKQRKPLWCNTPLKPTLNSRSRRTVQRRQKGFLKKNYANNPHQSAHHISTCCLTNYGYCSDPSRSIQKTLMMQLKTILLTSTYNQKL